MQKNFSIRDFSLFIFILVLFAAVLFLMGRLPWCSCGFGVWTWSAWSSSTSQHFGDPYSFSHILHGIIFYALLRWWMPTMPVKTRFFIAMMIEVAWELFENSPFIIDRYRAVTASLDYYGDSVLNSVGDVLFCMGGFGIAYRFSWKWTLLLFVAIELVMLFTIRDNLTLNVLMLIHPVQGIREWQMLH